MRRTKKNLNIKKTDCWKKLDDTKTIVFNGFDAIHSIQYD